MTVSNRKTPKMGQEPKPVSAGRHEHRCTICAHERRKEIEEAFVNWSSPSSLTKQYRVSRDSIYRHAHAFGLMERRRRNVRAALERIIERAGDVAVNAAAVVGAVGVYGRLNARGQWVERHQTVGLDALFERMSLEELEAYAKDGKLPTWFSQPTTVGEGKRGSHER